jgi:hypothetical protein
VFNIFSDERNVNKTILRFHFTPVILAIVKKTKITNDDEDASRQGAPTLWVEI